MDDSRLDPRRLRLEVAGTGKQNGAAARGSASAARKPDWYPDWTGCVSAVVASGPSARKETAEALHKAGVKIIAVNRSIDLAPFADVWYGADAVWWKHYKDHPYNGLRVSPNRGSLKYDPRIKLIDIPRIGKHQWTLPLQMGSGFSIGSNGNGGAQAVNACIRFGSKKVLLVGLDFTGRHWHGPHAYADLSEPKSGRLSIWRVRFDDEASKFRRHGIEVINLSQESALVNYRKATLEEVLREISESPI